MEKDIRLVSYNRYLHCDKCGSRMILFKINKEEIGACGRNVISRDISYEYICSNNKCDNEPVTSSIKYPYEVVDEEYN